MPLIAWAYIGFSSGLLAGFSGAWILALTGTLVAITAAMRRPSITTVSLFALFVAGVILAGSLPKPMRMRAAPVSTDTLTILSRQRARAAQSIETIFREDAPLAKALLVADQTEIPTDIKNRYADAGIVHMLSISGLHVAIIATAVELICQLLRLPVRICMLATVAIMLYYVAMIGFPPPAVRSAVMLSVTATSRLVQRPTSRWATLALGAWLPLYVPATILDLGYQLSVGGIAGLIASGALARRWLAPKLSGWQYTMGRSLLASSVATVVSAPLVAYAFGRISLIAPITNLLADPIVALAQPLLFLALVAAPLHPVATFVADAAHPVLATFDLVATAGASVPYATISVAPTLAAATLAGCSAVAIIVACVSRFSARPALFALTTLAVLPWVT